MTITSQESEVRNWVTNILPPATSPGRGLNLTTPGFVEIKPHTLSGIRSGLTQLGARLAKANFPTGVLATYLGTDSRGNPLRKGKATHLRVYGVLVNATPKPTLAQYNRPGKWHYLGTSTLRDTISHPPVDHAPAFGWAVEPVVQAQVKLGVALSTPKRLWTLGGGPAAGPDMTYSELAGFYRELARELRDPLYAELASELEAMAA
ncbi:hypothetical protein [Kribbella sp. CA-247076]|uniref:hypothetical protein n=1 Tax=Kribbella sp. CA-247076 TaxID=3239941 RepID=UPI003D9392A5